jgi:hypothetical protein
VRELVEALDPTVPVERATGVCPEQTLRKGDLSPLAAIAE